MKPHSIVVIFSLSLLIYAGLAGDIDGFRAAFRETATADEASTFLAEITRRYGTFLDMAQDRTPRAGGAAVPVDRNRPVVRYRLRFASGTVPAEAQFVRAVDGRLPMVLRWGWIEIHDADHGDLTYPVSAAARDEQ